MTKQPNIYQENSRDIKINETWKRVYENTLKSRERAFPCNVWEKDIEEKATQLLRYYTHKEDISSRLISYRNPEKLIRTPS